MRIFRPIIVVISFCLLAGSAFARLGETEAELFKRFGTPISRSKHFTSAQGLMLALGPEFMFKQDDWNIYCDLIDGRCMQIRYTKPGDWTEDQIQLVLNSNGQGARWEETSNSSGTKSKRTWRRLDGSTAMWMKNVSFTLTWSAYDKAVKVVEERARVESAIKKPKI